MARQGIGLDGTWLGLALALGLYSCHSASRHSDDTPAPGPLNGNSQAVDSAPNLSASAFNQPVANLNPDEDELHQSGDRLTETRYVAPPSAVNPGLGPYYNNNSCVGCHRSDGRGLPVLTSGGNFSQLIVKIGLTSGGAPEEPGGPTPVPGLGVQMQDQAVYGKVAPATGKLSWEPKPTTLADGTAVALRAPSLVITKADGTKLGPEVQVSLRLPPAFIGLGLLEAVSDDWLKTNEAASSNTPGRIPGRLNHVWSRTKQAEVIGRFGRKANKGLIRDQVALALALDIGLDNSLFPAADGGANEIDDEALKALTFYVQTLAAPLPRTKKSAAALHGQTVFRTVGCNGCHLEVMHTGTEHEVAVLRDQEIHPYTDLLLHDMGPDLADQRPDFKASGSEWRTPPLWGIGLQETVQSYSCYLHDGRAQSLSEAVLWHGGQATFAREGFKQLSAQDRADLLAFLGSL